MLERTGASFLADRMSTPEAVSPGSPRGGLGCKHGKCIALLSGRLHGSFSKVKIHGLKDLPRARLLISPAVSHGPRLYDATPA